MNLNSDLFGESEPNGQQEVAKLVSGDDMEPLTLRLRANTGVKSKRGRRVKKPNLTPGQKLITNMIGKGKNVKPKEEKEKK